MTLPIVISKLHYSVGNPLKKSLKFVYGEEHPSGWLLKSDAGYSAQIFPPSGAGLEFAFLPANVWTWMEAQQSIHHFMHFARYWHPLTVILFISRRYIKPFSYSPNFPLFARPIENVLNLFLIKSCFFYESWYSHTFFSNALISFCSAFRSGFFVIIFSFLFNSVIYCQPVSDL